MQGRKRNRIDPGTLPSSGIPKPVIVLPSCVVFSFKYLDLRNNEKFCVGDVQQNYLQKLLERLRDVCTFKTQEFLSNRSSALRCHPIDFADTTEPGGFPLNDQLSQAPPHQFSVSANEHGRVHGFLLQDTFYVVWIDPGHKLYGTT